MKKTIRIIGLVMSLLLVFSFAGVSSAIGAWQKKVFKDGDGSMGASGGYYVGDLYEAGTYLDFFIVSDRNVNNAVLNIRLANGLNIDINGFDGNAFEARIGVPTGETGPGGHKLAPGDQAVVEWEGGPYTLPANGVFADYLITASLPLKAGVNVLSFEVMANALAGGAQGVGCFGPLFDCIKINTKAKLEWGVDPETGRPFPWKDNEEIKYAFEAEHVDLTDKGGSFYSIPAYDEQLIVVDSPTLPDWNGKIFKNGPPKREQNPSNGLSIGHMYQPGMFIEFEIWSDRAVSDAKLEARLSAQYRDIYIAPLYTYTGGREYFSFTFAVNETVEDIKEAAMPTGDEAPKLLPGMLNYAPIALEGAAGPMSYPMRPFTNHLISTNVSLKAGLNSIILMVTNNEPWDSTITVVMPQIDCIYITTAANLNWYVHDYNARWAEDGYMYDPLVTNWIEVRKAFNESQIGDRD